jgi:hypothetical protein
MKTWKKLLLLVLLGGSVNLQAQLSVRTKKPVNRLPFGQTAPTLRQASDFITKASIPKIQAPFVVQLNLADQMQAVRDQCPLLLKKEPTLHLDGERSTIASVKLEWETTNGWNNQSFTIERSLSDSFHFETVNSVWAKQIAGVRDWYHQPDDNDFKKLSYYRIRLQLHDGTTRYSNIAPVEGYEADQVKLFPNPGVGPVMLTLYSDEAGDAVISTYDATGKLVTRQTVLLEAGYNTREMKVSNLAAGFYAVKVLMPDKNQKTVRLIRQ